MEFTTFIEHILAQVGVKYADRGCHDIYELVVLVFNTPPVYSRYLRFAPVIVGKTSRLLALD